MAVNQQLIDRLIAAGMPEAQVRIVVAALANVGSDGGLGTGAGGESTLEQAKESLRVEEEQFELLKQRRNITREMGTHIQDQSLMIDRMRDVQEEELEMATREVELAKMRLEIELNSVNVDQEAVLEKKKQLVEAQKLVRALKQGAEFQKSMAGSAQAFTKTFMGITGGPLDKFVDGLDVNAMNMKEMGKGMKSFGLSLLSSLSPMKVMSTLTSQAVETFMRFDKAQFEIFEQTGIMTAANDMAMLAEETEAFTNGGEEMKNTIVGLQQSFSQFQSVSATSRKELMLTTLAFEGLGVAAPETGQALATLIQALGQTPELAEENARKFSSLADELGRPPAEIISNFNKMSGALMKHGPAMQGEFMKLQAVAITTGMSIESLVDVTSKFDTFEDGAQSVGSLNAILGGPFLDTLTMMSGTTTDRLVELKSALDRTGEDFMTMSQARRQAIAQEMGMNVDELSKFMKLSSSEIRSTMKQAEVDAAKREKMEAKRMKMMDLMSKITVALQEAMEEVFGTEMFDSESLETVKGVFVSIMEVVKFIGKALGGLNTMFSKITGGKGAASGLMTLAAVAGLTLGGKMAFNMLKRKAMTSLLGPATGGAGGVVNQLLGGALGSSAQEVYIVGSAIPFCCGDMMSGMLGGGGGIPGMGGGIPGMGGGVPGMPGGGGMPGGAPGGAPGGRPGGPAPRPGYRVPTGQAGRFGFQVDRATRMSAGVGRFQGPGRINAAARGLAGRGLGGASSAMSVIGSGAGSGLGAKLLAGLGLIAGPLMSIIGGYKDVTNAAKREREKRILGGTPNVAKLGRLTVSSIAHPLANIALQFIPGFGTALSLIDGVLSLFGMSPIKWLISKFTEILPDQFFTGLGQYVLGDKHPPRPKAVNPANVNDAVINMASAQTGTRFNVSDTAEVVASKEGGVLASKLDKLIELMSKSGQKEIVIKIDRREIGRAALSSVNNDFYGVDMHKGII